MHINIYTTYSLLYNDTDYKASYSTIASILSSIGRKECVHRILYLLRNAQSFNTIEDFIKKFFSKSNRSFAEKIYDKINALTKRDENFYGIAHYTIISQQTCLDLLRVLFSADFQNAKHNCFSQCQIERTLFTAILLTNELIEQSENHINIPNDEKDMDAYTMILTTLPYNDYTNISCERLFFKQTLQAISFFEFCLSNNKFNYILQLFLDSYDCATWKQYILSLTSLFSICCNPHNPIVVLDRQSKDYTQRKNFLNKLSTSLDESINLNDNIDYVVFRDRPFIRLEEDSYAVIDLHFLCEKMYNSIRFEMRKINQDLPTKSIFKIKNFFVEYSTAFSERHLFYNTIKKIIGRHHYISHTGLDFEKKRIASAPDFYIRNGKHIFLFEFKDVMMRKEEKTSSDYEILKNHIKHKLVQKEDGSNSAIKQLANNYLLIYNGCFTGDKKLKPQKCKIYPILVVSDSKFVTQGVFPTLNSQFLEYLQQRGIANDKICPLILVDVGTLLLYQHDFEDGLLSLKEAFNDYYKFLIALISAT